MYVLVVEDDRALGLFLQKGLELEGHEVCWVSDGDAALASVESRPPNLIVLDLGLPRRDGTEVLEQVSSRLPETSVLVLTGRSQLDERVRCLNAGADDCLLKPFSFHELSARCRAILRRRTQTADPVLRFGAIEMNRIDRSVRRGGVAVELTAKEFLLLEFLLLRRGEVCDRAELLREVWQMAPDANTNVVDQNVAGYTRQTVSFSDTDSVSLSSSSNSGQWVTSTATSQRDRVLEQRFQQATSQSSASTARLTALQSVESSFGLSDTSSNASSTQLGSALDGFFSSLTALTANPNDATTRSSVLNAASTLASAFHTASSSISDVTGTLNSQITTAAQGVDALTSQIAQLNGQITALSSKSDTGALQDQRQQAVQQLSSILGVNVIASDNNGITLTASNGAVLVSGTSSFGVSTTTVNGLAQVVAGQPPAVQTGLTGGSIGGMLEARDSDLPQLATQLDQLANAVGTAINQQNALGQTSTGAAGSAIFTLPSGVAGSAAQISVATTDPGAVATAGTSEGASGTLNAAALSNVASNTIVNGQTASNFYAGFIGTLGNIVAGATTAQTSDAAATTQAQTTRDSFSAVSLDDEASQLQQYQRGYEAAAKVFSIINEIMGSAINLGTETTV